MTAVARPTKTVVMTIAAAYVLSGICQPLIMTLCKHAGLANSSAQLYMFFYYLGPAMLVFTLQTQSRNDDEDDDATAKEPTNNTNTNDTTMQQQRQQQQQQQQQHYPSRNMILKATVIAAFDICAQGLNYTGASLAGPTIFAVVYSSVTVWAAVFSRLFLGRTLAATQWLAVLVVFGGLVVTATNSVSLGEDVTHGTGLVLVGSAMHALTYVMSESVMTVGAERLTIRQNAAIQGLVACVGLFVWQLLYTWPRYDALILEPAKAAGTTVCMAAAIFGGFLLANFVHSISFYHTLKYYPGGSTSAGIMKALQAVLVFVAAHWLYCGRIGGQEMCFTTSKLVSLLTVVGGVMLFGFAATERQGDSPSTNRRLQGYSRIESQEGVEAV